MTEETKVEAATFEITVQRCEFRSHTFKVESENEEAAREIVMNEVSCDYDWYDSPISSANEEVIAITEKTS